MVALIRLFYQKFECSVRVDGQQLLSECFHVKSGVRQGCMISLILFLVTIDWVMKKTCDRPIGIQWIPFSQLEDLDFVDDLTVLSTKATNLQQKTNRLNNFANKVGLTLSSSKTKVLSINSTDETFITVNDAPLEQVSDFTYLGSVICNDNAAQKEIQTRPSKVRGFFARLKPIWKSRQYSNTIKLRLYSSFVKPVLLYGSECLSDMKKISVFHNGCLRRICRIYWPTKNSTGEQIARKLPLKLNNAE
ncbi:uncharacterized protein LOC128553077 [Mercenaria mercenaria]|uniref:uncharacterized protein LOC128553077 n=1 Tax=Mercenaria mercenaria TaxID=6596 RepID=UPI00234F8154|nr:uncharacterized protein LOC128553077 [Mercenaria mercenaria]